MSFAFLNKGHAVYFNRLQLVGVNELVDPGSIALDFLSVVPYGFKAVCFDLHGSKCNTSVYIYNSLSQNIY